jgi:hypothetical protein
VGERGLRWKSRFGFGFMTSMWGAMNLGARVGRMHMEMKKEKSIYEF